MKQSIVERAKEFATERHGDQKYGNGLPYTWHLSKVADLAMRLGYPEPIQAAAWLHDTVEDTGTDLPEIRQLFGDRIATIVEGVTYSKEDKQKEVDKIAKARSNPGSHVVKLCDASVNFSVSTLDGAPEGMGQWNATVDRYGSYIARLQPDLPTSDEVDAWLATIEN